MKPPCASGFLYTSHKSAQGFIVLSENSALPVYFIRQKLYNKMYSNGLGSVCSAAVYLLEVSLLCSQILNDFVEQTNRLYLENMKRVRDDVEWFINKFDHKYADEPWKNAKDSLTRAMIKTASVLPEEEKKKK